MVFDLVLPFPVNAGTPTFITPIRVAPLDAVFRFVRALIGHSDTVLPPSTIQSETADRSGIRQFHVPLIKASTLITELHNASFSGRSVLCVGGRMHLYPAYRQIIEDAGGSFLYFHGGNDVPLASLNRLLVLTDLVICPIDCIRHEAFWVTKHYCERFRKPCVMLDKSRVTTFYNGVRMLKKLQ
ncbi:hypothetical protein SAMN05421690_101041 [Nitrosomonas sp. Nm51]|uniref:DUF2325 domain-containing protein n=1 Tax=Nitrosomonas sp. Nm51 TaxID=133720 RepID=UPI0008D58571|nr:DUF2325 domain-containing protein [Nitrosomonas sp. Nm51]SER15742.1 hypothetical protein SAMN05421690_101041 [Nitrosomonas sp. Nm51]